MNKKHLRFCCMYGILDSEEAPEGHPQEVMKRLGITYQHSTPQSMGEQWWFWNCENIPEPLPPYLEILNLDPMEQIGWGLTSDMAEKIRNNNYDHLNGQIIGDVVIAQYINQVTTQLVGAIWTDKDGKIHFVGLKEQDGLTMPDIPNNPTPYIADVAQVGILKCT